MFMGEESSTAQSAGTRVSLQKGGGSKSLDTGNAKANMKIHHLKMYFLLKVGDFVIAMLVFWECMFFGVVCGREKKL